MWNGIYDQSIGSYSFCGSIGKIGFTMTLPAKFHFIYECDALIIDCCTGGTTKTNVPPKLFFRLRELCLVQ